MALIELSPETPAPTAPSGPPVRAYRRVGLLVAAILTLALGGAVPAGLTWESLGEVPLGADEEFALAGGRLVTSGFTGGRLHLSGWSAETPPRRLWQVTNPDGNPDTRYGVTDGTGGLVLLDVRRSTTVLDGATGAVRWRSATPLRLLRAGIGLVSSEEFRPGTEYDQASGDPGRLYGTTTEVLHTEPPLRTVLTGVDLATGATRWTVSLPGSVVTSWTGAELVVFTSTGFRVLSPATGETLRETTIPAPAGSGPSQGEVLDGVAVISYGDYGAGGRLAVYDLATLQPLWQRDLPSPGANTGSCTGLLCVPEAEALVVLDPRDGQELVRRGADSTLLPVGDGHAIAVRTDTGREALVLDLRTGKTVTSLTDWAGFTVVPGGGGYLLTSGDKIGLLNSAGKTFRLGDVPGVSGDCEASTELVACRSGGSVALYRYGH